MQAFPTLRLGMSNTSVIAVATAATGKLTAILEDSDPDHVAWVEGAFQAVNLPGGVIPDGEIAYR